MEKLFELIKNTKTHPEVIKLIQPETDLNIKDVSNNYLLNYAIILNNPLLVSTLLDNGAKIDILDNEGRSLLYDPIRFGYIEIIELLLKHNNKFVGISIIDTLDKKGMAPIHYVIQFRNIQILELFLKYNFNPNIINIHGEYPLHLSISTRNDKIARILIQNGANINSTLRTGENSLHLAINFKINSIAELLIDRGININKRDNIHEYTPLHYVITLNNNEIFKKLIYHPNIDINIQDFAGNAALHYIFIEQNYNFINLINDSPIKHKLNCNLYNYQGKIPLMLFFENYNENIDNSIITFMIMASNINFKNINGYTCLSYMIKLNIWRQYKHILINKKLNVFIGKNKRIIDMIPPSDINEFMDLLTDSYYNYQTSYNKDWKYTFTTKKDIKKRLLSEYKNPTGNFPSYPVKKTSKKCGLIQLHKHLEICTFTGINMDIIFGMLYLFKKYNTICSPVTEITFNNSIEQINLEILWNNNILKINTDLLKNFTDCINKNKRFIIIPLGIDIEEGSHANYLLYDNNTREIERFEPYGAYGAYNYNYNRDILDMNLEKLFNPIGVKYINPAMYLPKIGFQFFETLEEDISQVGDPTGFCAVWSIWYIDQRLTYNNIERKLLVKKLIKEISYLDISYNNLIRNYSKVIIDIRDNIFEKVGLTINRWINNNYTENELNNLVKEINLFYKKNS